MKTNTNLYRHSNLFSSEDKVRASRPIKMAMVGISGLDVTVTLSELAAAVAEASVSVFADIKTGVAHQRILQCMGSICLKFSQLLPKDLDI